MYEARIDYSYNACAILGPTDTRDEASRLARAWIEAHPGMGAPEKGGIGAVRIVKVEDEDED